MVAVRTRIAPHRFIIYNAQEWIVSCWPRLIGTEALLGRNDRHKRGLIGISGPKQDTAAAITSSSETVVPITPLPPLTKPRRKAPGFIREEIRRGVA